MAVVLLLPFSYIPVGPFSDLPHTHLVDIADAYLQMKSSYVLALCLVGESLCIVGKLMCRLRVSVWLVGQCVVGESVCDSVCGL